MSLGDASMQQARSLSSLQFMSPMQAFPPSPDTSGGESSSRLSRYGSISTFATSNPAEISDWIEQEKARASSMEGIDFEEEPVRLPASKRPKGHYSLTDFAILRTLGTGSFGRVHLGTRHTVSIIFSTLLTFALCTCSPK